MKILLMILLFIQFKCAFAVNKPIATIDVYGTNSLFVNQIAIEYQHEINEIANATQHGTLASEAINKMTGEIKTKGNFAYVALSPILYQNDPLTHITIDVVERKDKHRLAYFLPKPHLSISDSANLIAKWRQYEKTGFAIVFKTKKFPTFKHCPAQHCLFGFEHPALQKYKNTFNTAEKYKANLIEIARHDKDEYRRAAAIFVLGHIKNDQELITAILPSIRDSSSLVRNNVMRVLGAVLSNNRTAQVSITEVCNALDYPSTTDRNKALYMIFSLINDQTNAEYVKRHAGHYLMSTLKLQQPNNHDFSYQILKKISGKNYGERDYNAWEKWLS